MINKRKIWDKVADRVVRTILTFIGILTLLIVAGLFKTKICIDNELAALKYILIPILFIETGVFICYPDETFQALSLSANNITLREINDRKAN